MMLFLRDRREFLVELAKIITEEAISVAKIKFPAILRPLFAETRTTRYFVLCSRKQIFSFLVQRW
jgi:hypothetical protein